MDREKQIDEIYEEIKYGTGSYSDDARSVAEILYDIGYRKQSEVAREIFDEIERTFKGLLNGDISDILKLLSTLKKKYEEKN